jgi:hypothetical protein
MHILNIFSQRKIEVSHKFEEYGPLPPELAFKDWIHLKFESKLYSK